MLLAGNSFVQSFAGGNNSNASVRGKCSFAGMQLTPTVHEAHPSQGAMNK